MYLLSSNMTNILLVKSTSAAAALHVGLKLYLSIMSFDGTARKIWSLTIKRSAGKIWSLTIKRSAGKIWSLTIKSSAGKIYFLTIKRSAGKIYSLIN